MKKALLSLAVLAAVAPAFANETTVNFKGDGDVYGLTRFIPSKTNTGVPATPTTYDWNLGKNVDVPWIKDSYSFTEEGVNFTFANKNAACTTGFMLAKSTKTSGNELSCDGICFCGNFMAAYKSAPEVTVTVPGGTISKVIFGVGGNGVNNATSTFRVDGTAVEVEGVSLNFYISYEVPADQDKVVLTLWNEDVENDLASGNIFINYITVVYTEDLGGKQECGLAFDKTSLNGTMGKAFTAPTLSNPNNLPITWSSSDEKIATVDANGKVNLVGPGVVTITAATEGNDTYAAGNVKYSITVMGAATNILQLKEYAPNYNDKVLVNFPMTVTYASHGDAWVIDAEGNATEIHNTKNDGETGAQPTIYKVGNVIPAGWTATNEFNIHRNWTGLPASENLETVEVTYPEVESINYAQDAYRVLILKNVTFTTATDETDTTWGKTPDGKSYKFQNTFSIKNYPAGTYDATVIVNSEMNGSTLYEWLAPLAFNEVVEPEPEFPAEFTFTINGDINATQGEDQGVYTISVKGDTTEDKVVIKLEVPEGWDGFIGMTDVDYDPDFGLMKMKAYATEWVPLESYEAWGFKKVTELVFPADGEDHQGSLYLYKGDMVDEANQIAVEVNATKVAADVDPEFPDNFNVIVPTDANLDIKQGYDQDVYTIAITGECQTETITVTLEVPAGWDGFIGMTDSEYEPEHQLFKNKAAAVEWAPIDAMLNYGMKKGNALTFDADGEDYQGQFYLYKGDMVDMANQIAFEINVKKSTTTGVEAIEAADADARYFNLQGAEVVNPEAGIYVKVVNGKATKVVVK